MNSTNSPQRFVTGSIPDGLTLAAYGLTVIFGGVNAVAVRFTVAELPPFWGAVIRFTAAALIFWGIVFARKTSLPRGGAMLGVLLYGFLSIGAAYAFLYWGLQEVPAGLTQVILALVPLMTFFFAFFHGLESFRWRGLLGAMLSVAGISFAFFEQPGGNLPLLSTLAIVAGAACIAESTVVIKMYPQTDPFMVNALAMTVGTLMLVVLSLFTGEAWSMPIETATWASIVYLVVFGSVVVFYLFLFVIRRWTASATSYAFVLFPFITVIVAGWLASETVNAAFLIGATLVLLGVWVGALTNSSSAVKS